jgi:hypothetical protein
MMEPQTERVGTQRTETWHFHHIYPAQIGDDVPRTARGISGGGNGSGYQTCFNGSFTAFWGDIPVNIGTEVTENTDFALRYIFQQSADDLFIHFSTENE